MDISTIDRSLKYNKEKIQSYYIVNEYFQDKGKTIVKAIEDYIIQEASNLL